MCPIENHTTFSTSFEDKLLQLNRGFIFIGIHRFDGESKASCQPDHLGIIFQDNAVHGGKAFFLRNPDEHIGEFMAQANILKIIGDQGGEFADLCPRLDDQIALRPHSFFSH